jgi:hypothetical protein
MFRSRRRPVVYPQAEHARLAATLASAWGNERFPRPPLPFDSFVRGVALHDRGYGELDADGIGEVPPARWLAIQRTSFGARGEDAVADLVVALHVRRLVARSDAREAAAMGAALPALREAAGVSEPDASAADAVTDLCDRVFFDFCLERAAAGAVEVAGGRVSYAVDGAGGVTLAPWPLAVPALVGVGVAFRADGYPHELAPVVDRFRVEPG